MRRGLIVSLLVASVAGFGPPPCSDGEKELFPSKCTRQGTVGPPGGMASGSYCASACSHDWDCPGVSGLTAACSMNQGDGPKYCEYKCSSDSSCPEHGSCQKNIVSSICTYTGTPGPTPTPPPSPAPVPTPDNPLGIVPDPVRSKNFFLLIGDYGHQDGPNDCTSKVAGMMKDYVKRQRAMGNKPLFVGALGDNFYSRGLTDASKWSKIWSNVYGVNDPSSELHNIPWMGVMGNHDMGGDDPGCACGKTCKQISTSPGNWYMPDLNWNYHIPGVELEIIGLDTNALDVGGLGGDGCHGHSPEVCNTCGWGKEIQDHLNGVKAAGEQLLDRRAQESPAKTVLIMQHYDYEAKNFGFPGKDLKERFERGNGGRAKVLSAYGHRHEQECQGSRENGCDLILSGGGGGWRGGGYFGFAAVHLTDDGGYNTVLETPEVRMSQKSCRWWGSGLLQDTNSSDFSTRSESVVV